MNKTNDFKFNLPAYSDPVDIEDLNDNFRGIDDALMAGLCKKDYTGNNMGSSDPSARKYAWAPWFEIVNDNEFDVVVADRNAPVESEEATINIAAGQTFRKYINGRYYMNFYVQDQHDVTFKWFTNAEAYINESGGGGGGTGTVTSVSVQGGSGSHLTASGNPIETSGTITIDIDDGYSIPSDNEQTAWDGKAADLKAEIDSSTYVLTLQLKDSSGNLIGNERTIDLPLETMVVDGEYDSQTKKIKLELKNGNYVEFSVADLVSGLQTELSASNKLDPDYIDYDASHRAVSDTEKQTWNGKQASLDSTQLAAVNSGIDSAKVAQISTNQTNILYNLNMGVKNILPDLSGTYTAATTTYTWNYKGEIHFKSTDSSTHATDIGTFTLKAGTYVLDNRLVYSAGGATQGDIRFTVNGESVTYDTTSIFTLSQDSIVTVKAYTYGIVDTTLTPLLCTKAAWDQSHDYMPPALPNYDLTYLEAQDRAELVELVDNGAKNIVDLSATGSGTRNAVTFTNLGNNRYKVNGTPSATDTYLDIMGTWSSVPSFLSNNVGKTIVFATNHDHIHYGIISIVGGSALKYVGGNKSTPVAYTIPSNLSGALLRIYVDINHTYDNVTAELLVCTNAAFGVSQKFVPYRPNYDAVSEAAMSAAFTHQTIQNADLNSINKNYYGLYQSAANMPSGTSGFAFVRTTWFDSQAAMQELTLLAATSNSYVRVKYGNAWTAWKQVTNA